MLGVGLGVLIPSPLLWGLEAWTSVLEFSRLCLSLWGNSGNPSSSPLFRSRVGVAGVGTRPLSGSPLLASDHFLFPWVEGRREVAVAVCSGSGRAERPQELLGAALRDFYHDDMLELVKRPFFMERHDNGWLFFNYLCGRLQLLIYVF